MKTSTPKKSAPSKIENRSRNTRDIASATIAFASRIGGIWREVSGRRALRPHRWGDAVTAIIPGRWVWRGSACRFASRGFGASPGARFRCDAALHGEGAVNDLLLKRVLYGIAATTRPPPRRFPGQLDAEQENRLFEILAQSRSEIQTYASHGQDG